MALSESPLHNFEHYYQTSRHSGNDTIKDKEALSARKLAATLWEINGLHSPGAHGLKEETFQERRGTSHKVVNLFDADPHTPVCNQQKDGSKVAGHRRRSSSTSQKLLITEHIAASSGMEIDGKASFIEVASLMPGLRENKFSVKTRLKDVNNSLTSSKELVKILFRLLSQEEPRSSKITIVSALRVELDRARHQVDKSIQEQRLKCDQMDSILKQIVEEKEAWKSRERKRIRETVSSLAKELEIERNLRRQTERLNKKLEMELADTRAQISRAMKVLDSERRDKEILEQTCDELARGIGEERVEVEELKRESAKAREEVEKERQMLQLADLLREERVQMKLAEARYEYEEKNEALQRLKSEIETYLIGRTAIEEGDSTYLDFEGKTVFHDFIRKTEMSPVENDEGEIDAGEEVDSDDIELHSTELNKDNNNRSYRWSFACEGKNKGDSRRASMDEVFKGRRSLSEKIQWETICLQRNPSSGGI